MKPTFLISLLLASAVTGRFAGTDRAPASPPAAAVTAPVDGHDHPAGEHTEQCSGAEADAVTARFDIRRAVSDSRGNRVEVDLVVDHQFGETAAVIGALEIVDDRGVRIGGTRALPHQVVSRGHSAVFDFETPADLAPGYYRVVATVLARPGKRRGADDVSTHDLFFKVVDGDVLPISHNDWLAGSDAGQAFTQP